MKSQISIFYLLMLQLLFENEPQNYLLINAFNYVFSVMFSLRRHTDLVPQTKVLESNSLLVF